MTDNLQSVTQALQQALNRTTGSLIVRDNEFSETLRIGQIIKGKVMLHYEGGRYLVNFSGREKVVDSTVPLRTDELFSSRVVALGKQVHLQRLHNAADVVGTFVRGGGNAPPDAYAAPGLGALLQSYNATLSPADLNAAATAVRGAANPEAMGLSALLLHKLGVRMTPEMLQALYRRLSSAGPRPTQALMAAAPQLAAGGSGGDAAVDKLAGFLHQALGENAGSKDALRQGADDPAADASDLPEFDFSDGDTAQRDPQREWFLGQWLLGVQSHPRVTHRLLRIPVWFGDQIREVSVAMFSEAGGEDTDHALHYRRVVFFVTTDRLGKVQVTVNAAGRRLRVEIAAGNADAVDRLARHVATLRDALGSQGWQVDEVDYLEASLDEDGAVLSSVVHHHIAQDSLSRLM